MKLQPEVLAAIRDHAVTDGCRLTLTGPRFDDRLYQRVNDVLEAVGGRWDKHAGVHIFPADAAAAIAPVLATGHVVTLREKRQQAQFFPTPPPVVERLLDLADLAPGMTVLEPSAGSGAIATAIAARDAVVDCVEQDPGYAAHLADLAVARTLTVADFLTVPPRPEYDRVVMNPPFTRGADMAHVEHALRFLKPDGRLVSVMSWAVAEPSRATARFRALVGARGGTVEATPRRAFAASGTDMDTVLVTIPATPPADAAPIEWPVREQPAVDELAYRDPAEILDEIRADLHAALAEFDALAELLAKPAAVTRRPTSRRSPRRAKSNCCSTASTKPRDRTPAPTHT
ncbi:methyltransferase [Streptomyces sp. NPDC047315]|uniref:methyltransferase n=1 Tax=Streptomyces sp. NPDC047315 TaxID=3155142 RepID=UPI003407B6DD